ncbi:MAG: DUF1326 domain-containing protein [Acidobacteria bacterium]|nr:DUF1326 domain-containing protein [Acidobacteriota bacterium]
MKRLAAFLIATVVALGQDKPWKISLEYIEACSCSLFCPCYFNKYAQDHHTGEHHCNFNNVPRVLAGNYGDVDLKGMKIWLNGDLGADWATKGEADWLVVTFEPKSTKEQRDAMGAILGKIYPVKWKSFQTDTSEITWSISPDGKTAHAKIGNGKAEVKLVRYAGHEPNKPTQIANLKYFAANWNGPFSLYYSDHYYRGFGKSYDLKGTNGFTIKVEASSDGKRVTQKSTD